MGRTGKDAFLSPGRRDQPRSQHRPLGLDDLQVLVGDRVDRVAAGERPRDDGVMDRMARLLEIIRSVVPIDR
ncbi:hypothetical protein BRC95_10175 [Halobacteriales archaeon QS_5_68_33]|nr:MAG: hypothetical protein BRC95_10175 [Halobacteriales archaeon QS_5_68_33]